ncbi:TolC family protein [Candidatus Babeliales bacterium]|nr:TolC family protein [Candidatus Babeliales bacterium]
MIKVLFIKTTFIVYCILISQNLNAINNINLTMEQAVNMAYKHKPSLKAKKFTIQASKHSEKSALSGYFPQITINQSNKYATGIKGLQSSFGIQTNQLIYSFAGPLEKYKIAKKGTAITKHDEETHKDLVKFEVETSFLQSWLLQKKNEFIKTLNIASKEKFNKSKHQNDLNLLGKNDWLNEIAIHAQNLSTVHIYTDELDNAQNKLEFLIGKSFDKDIKKITLVWDKKKEITLKNLNYYYNLSLKNRKELKGKQKEIEQQEEYKKFHIKNYLPSVSISGQSSRRGEFLSNTKGNACNSISLQFNWNILDGGASYHESNKANANRLKALMEKNHYSQQIKYEVEKAYNDLSSCLKQLAAKDIKLTQAKNEFDLAKLKFKIGDISKTDFDQTKNNWETEDFDWTTLKVAASIKERQLIYACGYPKILI